MIILNKGKDSSFCFCGCFHRVFLILTGNIDATKRLEVCYGVGQDLGPVNEGILGLNIAESF